MKALQTGHLHLRAALEIKGPKSNCQQFRGDIDRLLELRTVVYEEDQAMIFAYVTCPLRDTEREADAELVEQSTGLTLSQFRIRSAVQDSCPTNGKRRSHIYMHIISGIK